MGELVIDGETLDARFVAAVWPMVLSGWPARRRGGSSGAGNRLPDETVAVVSAGDLGGCPPFAGVVVHPWPWADDGEWSTSVDDDPRVLRLALAAGTTDVESAALAVAALDRPYAEDAAGAAEAATAASDGVAALDSNAPAQAAALLTSVLSAGVPADAAERVRALALPILGD
jgi:hypothetical protein